MPVIKSAKKKLRQDRKREKINRILKTELKIAIKTAEKSKSLDNVRKAVKIIDKASKRKLIHPNKAARIKSKLSKLTKTAAPRTGSLKIATVKAKQTKKKK